MQQVNLNGPFVRAFKKWAIGMTISTPIIAVLQGAILLYDYRSKHGDAPRPDVPSRGIVVAAARAYSDDDDDERKSSSLTKRLWALRRKQQQQLPPLRLLVIGDSLAAGVGIRESSTPILPASIAKELSSALEGRPVYWTCVGTPGISSSLLVQDIYQLEEGEDRPIIMLQRWAEWQTKRAQARIEAAKREAQEWLEHRHDEEESDSETNNKERSRSDKNNKNAANPVGRWIRRRVHQIQRDVNGLVRVVRSLDLRRRKNIDDEDSVLKDGLQRRGSHRLRRHPSVDPAVVGPYDIAVVLTGLNDLKDAFLPFMMSAQRKQKLQEAQADEGVEGALLRIVHALEDKMPFRVPEIATRTAKDNEVGDDDNTNGEPDPELKTLAEVLAKKQSSLQQDEVPKHAPLVVFPALPINPIEMSQVAPLNWFLIPIIRAMDHNKKQLAEMFPGLVVFVDSPSNQVLSDVEAKRGPLWENSQNERILLQLTDVAQKVRERVETLMKQHYHSWFSDQEDDPGDEEYEDTLINATLYELEVDGVCLTTLPRTKRQRRHDYPGSTMVSCDGVHPSDFGYDFWGRYIAAAIIKELKLQSGNDCEEENKHAVHTEQ